MITLVAAALFAPSCVAAFLSACAPQPAPVFQPLSYRDTLPRISVYPKLAMPGHEVIIVARPVKVANVDACVRVVDRDGFAWLETCGDTSSRRVTFRPTRTGHHTALIYYETLDGPRYAPGDRAEFCVLGEEADCP